MAATASSWVAAMMVVPPREGPPRRELAARETRQGEGPQPGN
ncbi:MAG: hypothetical protein ACREOY_05360 [Candidatus Dormibacteraceae bacterium]